MGTFSEPADLAINLRNVELVEEHDSSLQNIRLFRHPTLGLALVINDELQHVEAWQALYHEPLVHLPTAFVPILETALVLGGGSLFAAHQLLKYPTLTQCTLVDHDPSVLEMMVRHYPHARTVIANSRFRYVQADALAFLKQIDEQFDLILNDCLDFLHPTGSTNDRLLALLSKALRPDGICSDLIYKHIKTADYLSATKASLGARHVALSLVTAPEYPGALHALTMWGSSKLDQSARQPLNQVQLNWQQQIELADLEFYDPRFLAFHLYLPPYLRDAWG